MTRALGASLDLGQTLETVHAAERTLELALAGTASVRALEGVVSSLLTLRDRMGEMRKRSDVPPWFQEEFARLGPSLGNSIASGRSLLAFTRGEIEDEAVLLEDLLDDVKSEHVSVQIGRGAETVSGDPALLRVALRALLDHVRQSGGGPDQPVEIRAEPGVGKVLISVGAHSLLSSKNEPGVGMSLVRRIAQLHGGTLTTENVPGDGDFVVLSLRPR
jgi:signal transduction histidine kinase